jgi:hypothetical protein
MTPVKSRGMLSTLNQLMVTLGVLSAYLVVICPLSVLRDGWCVMLGFAVIPFRDIVL